MFKLFRRKIEKRYSPENPSVPLDSPDLWMDVFGGASDAGLNITPRVALTYASFWQAVNLLSGDAAKLPVSVYHQTDDGSEKAIDHPANYLLRRKPNEHMTAFVFKQVMFAHALTWGNGYGWINRDGAGRPAEILLLGPDRTKPLRRPDGTVCYVTKIAGSQRTLPAQDVFHLKGLGFDGLQAYGVVEMAKQSLALGLAAEKFGNKFFSRGAVASGVLTHPGKLKQVGSENLLSTFEKQHQGLEQSHRTILLEEGTKFTQLTIPPDAAQFLETRSFQRVEVASWFNLPPHKLGDSSKANYNSLEQENRSYLESSLDPWLTRFEEEAWDKLLTEQEKRDDSHNVIFDRDKLLVPDKNVRYASYSVGRNAGFLSVNDIRRAENLPAIGPAGDIFLQPLNHTAAGDAARAMLRDTLGRMVRRLTATIRRGKPDLSDYERVFREAVAPALNAVRATGHAPTLDEFTNRHIEHCRQALAQGDHEALATEWETKLADTLAESL